MGTGSSQVVRLHLHRRGGPKADEMEVHIEKASGKIKKMRISNSISGFIHECEVKFPGCGVQEWSH